MRSGDLTSRSTVAILRHLTMDSAAITKILESQERAYKTAMEIVVKNLTDRIDRLEATVSDLTASLEFSQNEIDSLKSTIKTHEAEQVASKKTIDKLSQHIDITQRRIEDMEDRINYQEDYSRRNNIRISGVEELNSEQTWEQTAAVVTSLLEDKLQLPDLELERAHRVGQHRDGKHRPIVARFSRFCDREAVMRNARKLRGTNVYINDDLCAASQAIKNAQLPLLKQARALGKTAYFRHTKLIVKERRGDTGMTAQNQAHQTPVSNQNNQRGAAAVTEAHTGSDGAEEGDVVGLGSAEGGAVGGAGIVEQSDAVQAYPPLPAPAGSAGSPAALAVPNLRPKDGRKNPKRCVKK